MYVLYYVCMYFMYFIIKNPLRRMMQTPRATHKKKAIQKERVSPVASEDWALSHRLERLV